MAAILPGARTVLPLRKTGPLSPLHCGDAEIHDLRRELFGMAMSHGGKFKRLIDAVDHLWLGLIRGGR